jgi:hypothetical protein
MRGSTVEFRTSARSLRSVRPEIPTCARCSGRAVQHVVLELPEEEVSLDLCGLHLQQLVKGARRLKP